MCAIRPQRSETSKIVIITSSYITPDPRITSECSSSIYHLLRYYEFVLLKTLIEFNHMSEIILVEGIIEFEERLYTLLEEKHCHFDRTGEFNQASATKRSEAYN